ncbi:hypothetical protein SHKM778_01440 [Streptomyces sp. KM77-8]|uniref:Uncharacterized protein n=1 Tax=Streptomyces haneummycinicus TaxID=3074435 RepID=A0AAT9H8Q2_9ACTN
MHGGRPERAARAARGGVRTPAAPTPAAPSAASPAAQQPSPGPSALNEDQLRAALVTETDLGEPWMASRGAATWRDGMLKAKTDGTDCSRLLDTLYTEELFGPPAGPTATATLDDAYNDSQLRYQVAAHPPADADRALAWVTGLPEKCGRFEATPSGAVPRSSRSRNCRSRRRATHARDCG